MKLKNLLTRFFLFSAFFIIGGASYAAYSIRRSDRISEETPDLGKLWFRFVLILSVWENKLNETVRSAIGYIISHILQIIALLISNAIASTYYKRHGVHNDDKKDLWQRVKESIIRP